MSEAIGNQNMASSLWVIFTESYWTLPKLYNKDCEDINMGFLEKFCLIYLL